MQVGTTPLNLVCENPVRDCQGRVWAGLDFLSLEEPHLVPAPAFEKLADRQTEVEVVGFRLERPQDWLDPAWSF